MISVDVGTRAFLQDGGIFLLFDEGSLSLVLGVQMNASSFPWYRQYLVFQSYVRYLPTSHQRGRWGRTTADLPRPRRASRSSPRCRTSGSRSRRHRWPPALRKKNSSSSHRPLSPARLPGARTSVQRTHCMVRMRSDSTDSTKSGVMLHERWDERNAKRSARFFLACMVAEVRDPRCTLFGMKCMHNMRVPCVFGKEIESKGQKMAAKSIRCSCLRHVCTTALSGSLLRGATGD